MKKVFFILTLLLILTGCATGNAVKGAQSIPKETNKENRDTSGDQRIAAALINQKQRGAGIIPAENSHRRACNR